MLLLVVLDVYNIEFLTYSVFIQCTNPEEAKWYVDIGLAVIIC